MKKFVLSISVLITCVITAFGAQELTWTAVLAQAKQVNPALKKADANLKQAQLNYSAAFLSAGLVCCACARASVHVSSCAPNAPMTHARKTEKDKTNFFIL